MKENWRTFVLRHPILTNAGLVVLSLSTTFFLLEIGFRIYIRHHDPAIAQTIENFQAWSKRDDTQLQFAPHPYLSYVPTNIRYATDGIWIRDQYFATLKSPRVIRIACLGGSTTMLKFPIYLQMHLNRWKSDFSFEVMDFGCNGWTLMESTINYLVRVSAFEPDIVILHHGANETPPRRWPGFIPDYSHFRKNWQYPSLLAFNRRYLSFSWLASYLMWRSHISAYDIQNLTNVSVGRHEILKTPAPGSREVIERNLHQLACLVKSHGGTLLVAPLPHNPKREIPLVAQLIEEFNDCSRDLAKKHNLPLAETDPLMQQHLEWFKDWVHVTQNGDFLKAQVYAMVIWDQLGLYEKGVKQSALIRFGNRQTAAPPGRDMQLFWDFDTTRVRKYDIYARMERENEFKYLGETASGDETSFRWKANAREISSSTSEIIKDGPQFGHDYFFKVIPISLSSPPQAIGNLTSQKEVKILERPLEILP